MFFSFPVRWISVPVHEGESEVCRTQAQHSFGKRLVKAATRGWIYLGLGAASVAVCSAIVFFFFPSYRGLLWLGLYTIPSHVFVSPFPHEPVLLFFAKSYSANLCALASFVGCMVAGLCDYAFFLPFLHHPRIRSKYANVGVYQTSVKHFRKSPFWAVVFAALTPFPFYPVKLLSICDRYPLKRYLPALALGRIPRYWCIAYVGSEFQFPNWSLLALAVLFLGLTYIQTLREKRKKSRREEAASAELRQPPSPTAASVKSTPSGKPPYQRSPTQSPSG